MEQIKKQGIAALLELVSRQYAGLMRARSGGQRSSLDVVGVRQLGAAFVLLAWTLTTQGTPVTQILHGFHACHALICGV
jgi:hypothetical protein